LPIISPQEKQNGQNNTSFEEREILYKLLFDMKSDLNDLKKVIRDLVKSNNLNLSNRSDLQYLQEATNNIATESRVASSSVSTYQQEVATTHHYNDPVAKTNEDVTPIIIDASNQSHNFMPVEEVEESLSLEDMEKEFILKALKKHHGKRKYAADDLGISERTLYRKIKQYDIKE